MKSKHGKILKCKFCGKEFYAKPYQINTKKFCSHPCYGQWKKGREEFKYWLGKIRPDMSGDKSPMRRPEMREMTSKRFKGKKLSLKHKEEISKTMKGRFVGDKHWNWKGKKLLSKSSKNLTYIRIPQKDGGWEYEHRIIAEQKIGRKIRKGEDVNHIDGNPLNNKPDNLEVLSHRDHMRKHWGLT
jgi:hypothetical protein